jgi:hypothetical protein
MTDEKQCIYYAAGLIQSMSKNEPIDFYGQSVRIINHEIDYKYPGDIDFVFILSNGSKIIINHRHENKTAIRKTVWKRKTWLT